MNLHPIPEGECIAWEPMRAVFASWCLEYAERTAVIFWQCKGNESRAIASHTFDFAALSECLSGIKALFPWKQIEAHVLASGTRPALTTAFEDANCTTAFAQKVTDAERVHVTREFFATLAIDQERRPWSDDTNNSDLVDSLNAYGTREMAGDSETFAKTATHSRHVYLVRAFETFAIWRHFGGAAGWGRNPNERRITGAYAR